MKSITIVSATLMEVQPLINSIQLNAVQLGPLHFQLTDKKIDFLITGIGILQTAYTLMDYLSNHKPDLWIQAGIGGAFDTNLQIGEVYQIESEILIDFGAEENDGRILSPFDLGWMAHNQFPYTNGMLICPTLPASSHWKRATGMTTLHAHGHQSSIDKLRAGRIGQVENMEGAAFFYVSLMKDIPFISVRSISNVVEVRDKSKWEIQMAIQNLNKLIQQFIHQR
ncbi:MAG: futalosine hydrolase [Bacteroidota bacterium]|nr:futalosine hydrolase [Bacteroidota bacterium]MDQ3143137.1 futalosine hydrolase [Bacteroidota bacterium]